MNNILSNYSNLLKKIGYILSKSEKRSLLLLSVGSVVMSLTEIFSIGIVVPIMILFSNAEQFQTSKYFKLAYKISMAHDMKEFFLILISIALALFIFKSAYCYFIFTMQQKVIGGIYIRLATRLMRDYLAKPYSFHLMSNSSLLFKNIVEEMGRFTTSFLNPAITMISETMIFFGVFAFSLFVYPLVTLLIVLIFGIVLMFLNILLIGRIKSYSTAREQQSGLLYVTATEALGAIKEIQMYDVNKYFTDKFSKATSGYTRAFVKFTTVSNLPRPILETFIFTLFLLGMMISTLLNKSFADLIPMMTIIGMVCLKLLSSISKIYNNIHQLYYHANAVDIVYDIIKKNDFVKEEKTPKDIKYFGIKEDINAISLKDIKYRYETAEAAIFNNFSLTIPLDKVVALVGTTGSGKSTLIEIIMELLKPGEGHFYYK
ncbi:MAG: ABC transporter transmembrane domain-containing protein, partial [Candidatus Omnitrophica bacterium]|nr:ABC transporter transmembrane domain-containing protein [Candidatus Omnitrophota bacterium]